MYLSQNHLRDKLHIRRRNHGAHLTIFVNMDKISQSRLFPFSEKKGKSKNKKKTGGGDCPKPTSAAAPAAPAVIDEPFVPPSASDRTPAPAAAAAAQSGQAAANVDRKKKRDNLKKVRYRGFFLAAVIDVKTFDLVKSKYLCIISKVVCKSCFAVMWYSVVSGQVADNSPCLSASCRS